MKHHPRRHSTVDDVAVLMLGLGFALYTLFAGLSIPGTPIPIAMVPIMIATPVAVIHTFAVGLPRTAWAVFFAGSLFACWVVFVDGVRYTISGDRLANVAAFPVLVLAAAALIRDESRARRTCYAVCLAASISALVALGQEFIAGPFVELWNYRWASAGLSPERLEDFRRDISEGRAAGLAPYSLVLAHQLVQTIPVTTGLILTATKRLSVQLGTLLLGIQVGGAFATGTRTASLIALGASLIVFHKYRPYMRFYLGENAPRLTLGKLTAFPLFAAVAAIMFPRDADFRGLNRVFNAKIVASGVIERSATYWFALSHVFSNPGLILTGLGTGGLFVPGASRGFLGSAHNQFIDAVAEYGVIGLVLVLAIYLLTFRSLRSFLRRSPSAMTASLAAGVSAYVLMSMWHDQGLSTGDVFHYLIIAIATSINFRNSSRITRKPRIVAGGNA